MRLIITDPTTMFSRAIYTTVSGPLTHLWKTIFNTHPSSSTSSFGGSAMENVRYFWHLYSKIIQPNVHFFFFFFAKKKRKWTLRNSCCGLLVGERLQTVECVQPVGILLHIKDASQFLFQYILSFFFSLVLKIIKMPTIYIQNGMFM